MQLIVSQPLFSVLAEVGLGGIEIHETYARVCDCKVAIAQLGGMNRGHMVHGACDGAPTVGWKAIVGG
jgi:hypothetical protein